MSDIKDALVVSLVFYALHISVHDEWRNEMLILFFCLAAISSVTFLFPHNDEGHVAFPLDETFFYFMDGGL